MKRALRRIRLHPGFGLWGHRCGPCGGKCGFALGCGGFWRVLPGRPEAVPYGSTGVRRRGDLETELPVESEDEVGQVSRQFNQMVTDLNTYIDRLIETEQAQQTMKYGLLISQINPHFIYNTMGIISILARNGQTEDIIAINNALIKILQDRLRVEHMQISDTVEQEVQTLKQYLLIQQYRYDYHVQVQWEIDPAYGEQLIPKNLLQPLVENALFHGLMDEETGRICGTITISIDQLEDSLRLTVRDNGRGIDASVVEGLHASGQIQRGRHIGLRNIVERLDYLYPGRSCLHIRSENGTIVQITLPLPESSADQSPPPHETPVEQSS